MRFESKIAVTGILTWVVFGLFNLFGQPGEFVPPLFFDYLFLCGLTIVFLYRLKPGLDFFSITGLCFSLTIAGLIEYGIETVHPLAVTAIIVLVLSFIFNAASVLMELKNFTSGMKFITALFYFLLTGFCTSFFILVSKDIIDKPVTFDLMPWFYWSTGLIAALLTSVPAYNRQLNTGKIRFFTLIYLSAFFDFMTWFSLNLLR